jgi:hypothetical protein
MTTASSPYAALPPVPMSIVIDGETLDLTPIRLGELPMFARAVQPVASHLSASPDWLALVAGHGEAVIDAVAIAARRPREWVAGLDLDEAVRLASAVFEVNADFFMRRLAPVIAEATAKVGALGILAPSPTLSNG